MSRQQDIAFFMSLAYPEYCEVITSPTGSTFVLEVVAWGVRASGKTRDEAGEALERAKRSFIENRLFARQPIPLPADAEKQSERWRLSLASLRSAIVASALECDVDVRKYSDAVDIDDLTKLIIGVARQQSQSKKKTATKKKGVRLEKPAPVHL